MTIDKEVSRLAFCRAREEQCQKLVGIIEADIAASKPGQELAGAKEALAAAKENTLAADQGVRTSALQVYAETQDKKPHPAVPIKIYTVLQYEQQDAIEYAREHLPTALKLNTSTFEKVAKVVPLDFVTISEEPRATIARDLTAYMPRGAPDVG